MKNIAERGFDPRTSGLWAQHVSTAPLCLLYLLSTGNHFILLIKVNNSNKVIENTFNASFRGYNWLACHICNIIKTYISFMGVLLGMLSF